MNMDITHMVELATGGVETARVPFVIDRFDQWNNPADSVVYATFTICRGDAIDAVT